MAAITAQPPRHFGFVDGVVAAEAPNQHEDLLNARPRKALGFQTPEEVFRDAQAPP